MTNARKTDAGAAQGCRPGQDLSGRRGREDGQGSGQGQVRRDHRDRDESRRRSPSRRPDGARCGVAAERLGPQRAGRRVRPWRQGRGGQGGWRRRGRRRGSGREGAERQHRLRPLHRHARPDAAGRPARQGARPARHDAEPEGRHRDDGRRRRRARAPRAARSNSASRRPASSRPASARPRSRPRSWSRTSRRSPTRCRRRSRRAPKAPSSIASRCPRPWAPASRSSRVRCSPPAVRSPRSRHDCGSLHVMAGLVPAIYVLKRLFAHRSAAIWNALPSADQTPEFRVERGRIKSVLSLLRLDAGVADHLAEAVRRRTRSAWRTPPDSRW